MKKWIGLSLLPFVAVAQTTDDSDKYGYSYFTVGLENVTYQEYYGGLKSDVTVTNPILNTGGLYYVNKDFDFSIDALASFSPQSSKEDWVNNGSSVQHNQMEYLKTATNIQLHYKLQDNWRVIGGPSLTYQTFTRYGVKNFSEDGNKYFYGTWEETSTDIFVDVGLAYDNGSLNLADKWHVSGKATFGLPVWSVTSNTRFEDVDFYDFGYRAAIEGSVSYELRPGLHLGWYAMFGYEKRFQSDTESVTTSYCKTMIDGKCIEYETEQVNATLPEADTYTFSTGLQALWSF
ncbi:hypothetical protein F2P58_14095 [Vibrio fortis]|uniref:Omptin family outer membrane protease n=1 Tax=Vibrio fortis TaxID=212667 RepID=A0A5N3QZE9_9VIBR|nr:hypothetical protein [Vibrio fortis]KAB0287567.1 hypothetical protein F2P58_14095 [Vibrio fortis]